eukprot:Cvel_3617.t2-p1 / transcript=Cvel_3617.t2 / gene=Cvel_3617 / organism=Chromera_velia_CCMP2878 / gene_product=hypothetical protein / transcript_product=hypothetical protein / location=Cvel_scaffold148:88586-90344(+) / protein_length=451 / sequence_SO=supercontig / SO=protein_coding / is_pseudo=false
MAPFFAYEVPFWGGNVSSASLDTAAFWLGGGIGLMVLVVTQILAFRRLVRNHMNSLPPKEVAMLYWDEVEASAVNTVTLTARGQAFQADKSCKTLVGMKNRKAVLRIRKNPFLHEDKAEEQPAAALIKKNLLDPGEIRLLNKVRKQHELNFDEEDEWQIFERKQKMLARQEKKREGVGPMESGGGALSKIFQKRPNETENMRRARVAIDFLSRHYMALNNDDGGVYDEAEAQEVDLGGGGDEDEDEEDGEEDRQSMGSFLGRKDRAVEDVASERSKDSQDLLGLDPLSKKPSREEVDLLGGDEEVKEAEGGEAGQDETPKEPDSSSPTAAAAPLGQADKEGEGEETPAAEAGEGSVHSRTSKRSAKSAKSAKSSKSDKKKDKKKDKDKKEKDKKKDKDSDKSKEKGKEKGEADKVVEMPTEGDQEKKGAESDRPAATLQLDLPGVEKKENR